MPALTQSSLPIQTNKNHRLVFVLVCLGLAVLLGWPSPSRADSASEYAAGQFDGYDRVSREYAAYHVDRYDYAAGMDDGYIYASDHISPDLTGMSADYIAGLNYSYPLYIHYFASSSYQSGFDDGSSVASSNQGSDGLASPNPYPDPNLSAGSVDSYTLTVSPFTGVVTQTGGFINSMIGSYGIPAILIAIAVAGWLFVKRIAKSAFH